MYSHCTDHAARMHVYIGSSLSCVPKIGHPSTRHVSPCASQCTEHQHKFSLTYLPLLCCSRPLLRTQTCCPRIRLPTVKIHGRYFHGIPLLHNSLWHALQLIVRPRMSWKGHRGQSRRRAREPWDHIPFKCALCRVSCFCLSPRFVAVFVVWMGVPDTCEVSAMFSVWRWRKKKQRCMQETFFLLEGESH